MSDECKHKGRNIMGAIPFGCENEVIKDGYCENHHPTMVEIKQLRRELKEFQEKSIESRIRWEKDIINRYVSKIQKLTEDLT